MSQTQKQIPTDAASFRVNGGAVSVDDNKFTLTPYSGQRVKHWYWGEFMFETSSMTMRKDKIAALVDHDTSKGCGVITEMKLGESAEFSGTFIENQFSDYVKSMRDVGMECSLQFNPDNTEIRFIEENETVEVNGQDQEGPFYLFKNAEIKEVSFTLFGAVQDTDTSFSQPSFIKETPMADEPKVDTAAIEASAKSEIQSRFKEMLAISDDASLVNQCFSEGMSVVEFSAKVIESQKAEIASLKAEVTSLKEAPAPAPAAAAEMAEVEQKEVTFMSAVEDEIKGGLSRAAAMSKVAKNQPELHSAFMDGCEIVRRKK